VGFSSAPLRTYSRTLSEVIPFACALVHFYRIPEVITQIAETNSDHLLGLSFLETKAYDHPKWNEFFARQQTELLTDPSQDADWLSTLHLFLLVCIDENRTARASRATAAIDIDDFIGKLASRFQSNIFVLIDEYARQDAVAAFRLASLCRVDILENNPRFVVQNCFQPPFLAMAMDRVSSDKLRGHRWSSALAEAGLSSLPVAKILHAVKDSPWREPVERIDYRRRWFVEPIIARTALTECITFSISSRAIDPVFEHLSKLSRHSAPGCHYVLNFFARYTGAFLAAIWTCCLTLALLAVTMEESLWSLFDLFVSRSTSRMIVASMFLSFIIGAILTGLLMIARNYFEKYARMFWITSS
jgi:hypothetical protein